MDTGDGEWIASRNLTEQDNHVEVSRDSFRWEPKAAIEFQPGAMLKWSINYDQPDTKAQFKPPADRDIGVLLYFNFAALKEQGEPRKPENSWLHLFRSTYPEERRLGATSLATDMWWDKFRDGSISGKASLPLDHLLAFGQGYDALAWDIQSAPDQFRATQKLARGMLPIAAMRNRLDAIPKLRKMLDKKTARYKQECDIPLTVTQ